jgi:hypothetical protein
MSGCTVKRCSCKHEYQDSKYGQNMRVHNFNQKKTEARCTVCGTKIKASE